MKVLKIEVTQNNEVLSHTLMPTFANGMVFDFMPEGEIFENVVIGVNKDGSEIKGDVVAKTIEISALSKNELKDLTSNSTFEPLEPFFEDSAKSMDAYFALLKEEKDPGYTEILNGRRDLSEEFEIPMSKLTPFAVYEAFAVMLAN